MSAEELLRLHEQAEQAYVNAALAGSKRNAAIRQAVAEGWSHARIAEAIHLSRARVGQLAKQP